MEILEFGLLGPSGFFLAGKMPMHRGLGCRPLQVFVQRGQDGDASRLGCRGGCYRVPVWVAGRQAAAFSEPLLRLRGRDWLLCPGCMLGCCALDCCVPLLLVAVGWDWLLCSWLLRAWLLCSWLLCFLQLTCPRARPTCSMPTVS